MCNSFALFFHAQTLFIYRASVQTTPCILWIDLM